MKGTPGRLCLFLAGMLCLLTQVSAFASGPRHDSIATSIPRASTVQEALSFLAKAKIPDSSAWWPHIRQSLFIENLKANLRYPLAIYQGSNTNFCGYAALSYLPLNHDPLAYAKFMITLYTEGQADWGSVHFNPSPEIHLA